MVFLQGRRTRRADGEQPTAGATPTGAAQQAGKARSAGAEACGDAKYDARRAGRAASRSSESVGQRSMSAQSTRDQSALSRRVPRRRTQFQRRNARARFAVVGLTAFALGIGTLSACGNSSSAPSDPNAAATGPLTVWVRGSGDSLKAYQKIFDAFTAKTGIQIKPFMTLTDFETKLSAAAAAHKLPDVVFDDAAQLGSFETQGIIQPINKSDITGSDQILSTAWKSATDSQGKVYAVPTSAQANVLLIRKDWLDKLNLQVPTTWADIENVAKAFTTKDPDGDGKNDTYGLDVPATTSRGYISWWWSSMLWQAGGDYVKSDGNGKYTATLDSSAAVSAAKQFETLACTDKVLEPGALNDDTTATNKAFQTGVAGMYFTGPYAFATMDATSVKGKYIVVAPPAGPANAETLAEGTDAYLMTDSKSNEAKQLLSFMITPQSQIMGMTAVPTATIVRLPVNKTVDAASVHKGDPRWALAEQVYQSQGHYEYDNMPNWTALRQETSNELNAMIANCSDPASAMAGLNGKFESLLHQQGVAG
jgi:multiple sugar transport system substrate-binding protein